jgi:hypothetical protein
MGQLGTILTNLYIIFFMGNLEGSQSLYRFTLCSLVNFHIEGLDIWLCRQ